MIESWEYTKKNTMSGNELRQNDVMNVLSTVMGAIIDISDLMSLLKSKKC